MDVIEWAYDEHGVPLGGIAYLSRVYTRMGNEARSSAHLVVEMLDVVTLAPAPDEVFIVYYILCNVVLQTPRCQHVL